MGFSKSYDKIQQYNWSYLRAGHGNIANVNLLERFDADPESEERDSSSDTGDGNSADEHELNTDSEISFDVKQAETVDMGIDVTTNEV